MTIFIFLENIYQNLKMRKPVHFQLFGDPKTYFPKSKSKMTKICKNGTNFKGLPP